MAEGFQHITVVPADDEIVIQAGARVAPKVAAPAVAPVEVPAEVTQDEPTSPAVSADDAKAEEQLRATESGIKNLSWAVHAAIAEEHAANPRPARMAYRETTLEDLELTPMPRMQKIVLGLMGGLVAIFAVYCLLRFGLHLF